MRTENEIKALPLLDQQKLVIELRQVKTADKAYPNAKAIITVIMEGKKWKEPELIEVTNIAAHDVTADHLTIAKGATGKVYPWQKTALARFLEVAGKAAALILFAALLTLGGIAKANPAPFIGGPGGYQVYQVVNGGTNIIPAETSTNFTTPVTNTISITTNANWTYSNGQSTNTPTYVTNILVVVPGVFTIPNYEDFTLVASANAVNGSTNATLPVNVDYSADGTLWQSNKWLLPIPLVATGTGTTNLDVSFASGGFIRLNNFNNAAINSSISNFVFEVGEKSANRGP